MGQVQRKQSVSWLNGVDLTPRHSIGVIVKLLRAEFPTLAVSKVRYFEDRGLVHPSRTKAGYRKYSEADIERIRYCLRAQRDSFKPLEAIREDLDRLDAGYEIEDRPVARIVAESGQLVAAKKESLTLAELVDATGVDEDDIEALTHAGLLHLNMRGRFSPQAIGVVTLAKELRSVGIEPRHMRTLSLASERAADLVDQVVNASSRKHSEQRMAQVHELGDVFASLMQLLVRQSIDEIE